MRRQRAPQAFWALVLVVGLSSAQALRFGADRRLSIVQATDIHYGEEEGSDVATAKLVRDVLAAEKPDLVVLSGDQVSGYAIPAANLVERVRLRMDATSLSGSWYEQQWRQLTAPLHEAGVPYAAILGNHDGEADLSRREVMALDAATSGGLSLSQAGPARLSGAGNYWVDVLEPGNSSEVAARIWFLDSGNRGCNGGAAGWSCLGHDIVDWVREQAASLPPVPSLAFVHIPIPQFSEAWSSGTPANGTKGEETGCPLADTGFFAVAKEFGIHAIYSGHDHDNDFAVELEGVRLAYGRKTGFGGYGPFSMQRGARVIELRMGEDTAHSTTWIRQQDGSRVFQQPAQVPRPHRQAGCPSIEGRCDRLLGPNVCLKLRGWRNGAEAAGALLASLAVLTLTVIAGMVASRHAVQHLRRRHGWRRLEAAAAAKTHAPESQV